MPEGQVTDQNPIINDPYAEQTRHWEFGEGAPSIAPGRRPSGYLPPADPKVGQLTITGDLVPLDLVNDLRSRVRLWSGDGYPGATIITRDLFSRWFDAEREPGLRPFFCQQEAMETLVFFAEAAADRLVGVDVPRTEAYVRHAVKMATGTGKTLVMAMSIAWSVLNKAASPQDTRFADAVLVVCPNLTVKERLAGLDPHRPDNEYRAFDLVPPNLSALFGAARVKVINWHKLAPEEDPTRSVLKRGPEGDAAFCRRVIADTLGSKRRVLVINDEAHHAYRHKPGAKAKREEQEEIERATVWIDGLERVHRDREILRCLDFSATPMYLPGSGHEPWQPFEWIVSDFALVDAVESGLVKIPRVPIDDNAGAAVPKYRNLWEHIKNKLPKRGDDPERGHALTDYLTHIDGPLKQLSGEWHETFDLWKKAGRSVPPAMIVICSETKMAEILDVHIARKGEAGAELKNTASEPSRTLRIDSRLLASAEARDEAESATEAEDRLRSMVATVGKEGEPGAGVRCLISVAMLSEGWDARNVTQILGLRAFSSQLLCEQVVGRGLRRSSYDNLSEPEFVDVYGVPFQLLPFAHATPATVVEPPRLTSVVALRDRRDLVIRFPRVVSIVHEVGTTLEIDWAALPDVAVTPEHDPTKTTVAAVEGFGGDEQTHEFIWQSYRRQKFLFEVASRVIREQKELEMLFPQAIRAVERFIQEKVVFGKGVDERELDNELYKTRITELLRSAIRPVHEEEGRLLPVLDEFQPEGTTADVAFQTAKDVEPTTRSHVNYVVCDSQLERHIARELESLPVEQAEAYVKNDHLFLEIPYRFDGRAARYIPDFVVRLPGPAFLLMEGKGREGARDKAKKAATHRWIAAVNADERWGRWAHCIIRHRSEVAPAVEEALAAVSVTAGS